MAPQSFIATKEHRRFTEFADAVRRHATIGICYGQAGVGKTHSARRYAGWDKAEPLLEEWRAFQESDFPIMAALARTRTLFYTPDVLSTPRHVKDDLHQLTVRASICIEDHLTRGTPNRNAGAKRYVQLIIIDESERLGATAIELLRDRYDRDGIALILIGMPGIEKRISRYPQLYSRVGFAHEYRPLGNEELHFVLERKWRKIGQKLNPDDFTDAQAVAAIGRITRGNFRLVDRLFTQIERVMKLNELSTITDDVVEAARSTLVIGIS